MATCKRAWRRAVALATAIGLGWAAPLHAQGSGWRSFVSVSPVFEDAKLDAGGDASVGGAIVRLGSLHDFGGGTRAGFTVSYDYFDYSFDNPVAFGGVAPWGPVQRYGVATPVSFTMGTGWVVGFTPSFDWFRENGAASSQALVWGVTMSAVKVFANGNQLGLGLAAFDRLEETSVFPFPIVNWRFDSHWRLVNPLAAGPTGPAGLELNYEFDSGWSLGIGAAWRKTRFRLSEDGPVANGIGQVSGAPIFLRAKVDLGPAATLNLYGGVVAAGSVRVEGPSGNLVREDDFDLAPLVGFSFVSRF
jgi:hypothetical protein